MFYLILYLVIGAIWSTICEVAMPGEIAEDIGGNPITRWLIGALLWPLEVFFLIVEITKN